MEPETKPDETDDDSSEVAVGWPEQSLPILVANVFVLQGFDGGILLTFGQASPPLPSAAGDVEVTSVEAKPLIRLSIPASRVAGLADGLSAAAKAISLSVEALRAQEREGA